MSKRENRHVGQGMLRLMVAVMAFVLCMGVVARKKPKVVAVQPVILKTLSENESKRFNYFYLEAVRRQQLGQFAAAYDLYSHCLEINPTAPEVYFELASYYSELRNDSLMLASMEKAAQLSPDNNTYLERLGQTYIKTRSYDKATEVYERLAGNNPGRTEVLSVLLQLYQFNHEYDKVVSTLERIETIEGSSEELTLSKMQVYAMQGETKKEFNELRTLSRQHPYDYKYRVMMGNWLLQHGKEKEALAEYNAVLKKEPDNIMAQMSLLDYYKSQDQDSLVKMQTETLLLSPNTELESKMLLMRQFISNSEATGSDSCEVLQMFDKILKQPQPDASMAELCAAYMSIKKMPADTINSIYEHILEIEPDHVGARIELLQSAWSAKNYDRVVALAKPAVEYSPDNILFYYFLGLAYSQKDETDLALDTFRKGVGQANEESNKSIVSDFYSIMGDILHEKGQYAEAYAAYDSCLQWKADNIGCLNNYAYFLSVEGKDLSKAEQMSYRTVKAEPANATYLDTYAWILFKQQRYAEARIYIDQALAADSTVSEVIIEHAGDIYMMNNEPERAVQLWQEALNKSEEENALLQRKIKMRKYIEDPNEK